MKNIYKITVELATPNESGKQLDFTHSVTLKKILGYINEHNSKQVKKIKIYDATPQSLTLIMSADNIYGDGRDLTALSNIMRQNGWLNYSGTNQLLTAKSFSEVDAEEISEFDNLSVLPSKFNYIHANDVNNIIDDSQALELLKTLTILANNSNVQMVRQETKKKYQNSLYRIKEALYDAFN